MSYSPLPQVPAESSADQPPSASRSPSPDSSKSPTAKSSGDIDHTAPIQSTMDRLSLQQPKPSYPSSDAGIDSMLSLVRSFNSDTQDSYDMLSDKSSSPAAKEHENLEDGSQESRSAGVQGRYKDSKAQHRLSDSGILVTTDPDTANQTATMHDAASDKQKHAEYARVSQDGLQLDRLADVLAQDHNARSEPADGSASPRRPQLQVHTAGTPPPPNVLNPHDPTFEYTHSPEDVAAALQYVESHPLPEPDYTHEDDGQYYHEEHGAYGTHDAHEGPGNSYGAPDFFQDFDGVHCSPDAEHPPSPSPPPTDHRELASQKLDGSQSAHHSEVTSPSRGSKTSSNLVYYPAPVPAVLNLPPLMAKPKTSRFSKLMKRGSKQLLETEKPQDGARSVAYPGAGASAPGKESSEQDRELRNRQSMATLDDKRLSHLPPALRASTYFDSHNVPPPSVAPEIKEASAVATLDSILDASARAPPAAFTDHPIMGASANPPGGQYRNSMAVTVKLHPGESPRSSVDGGEHSRLNPEEQEDQEEGQLPLDFGAPPSTLMAELEARKAQQKLRTRTAASAFPTGMHSTLLQLDAVAQVQARSRRQKRPHLAWEGPDEDEESDKDEDVPLGLLYTVNPALQRRKEEEVPLGLLMKKEMEDAEPLSKRRERLRQQVGLPSQQRRFLDVPGMSDPPEQEPEEEGETLAQRMKRLREQRQSGSMDKRTSTFGDGSLEISFLKEDQKPRDKPPPPEDETLAQRRKRLALEKEEEEKKARLKEESAALQQQVRQRRSMAGLLQQYPQTPQPQLHQRESFYAQPAGGMSVGNLGMGGLTPGLGGPGTRQTVGLMQPGMNMGMAGVAGMPHGYQAMNYGGLGAMGMNGMNMGYPGAGVGVGGGMAAGMTIDPKQQEMIERWRSSVM